MNNIKKYRTKTPIAGFDFSIADPPKMDDILAETYAREDAKAAANAPSKWTQNVDSIVDSASKLFGNIIAPIFGWDGQPSNTYIVPNSKENITKYIIIGVVIIVALVLLLKFVKK